jgi:peptide/nickel transport system ATP-binding protein
VMRRLQEEFGTAIVLITHELGVVAAMADDVVVMYAGKIMERASRREVFYRHHNPYTEGLFASLPGRLPTRARLRSIKGSPPSLINLPPGCPFRPRCPYAFERCIDEPPLFEVFGDRDQRSACWLPPDVAGREAARERVVEDEERSA